MHGRNLQVKPFLYLLEKNILRQSERALCKNSKNELLIHLVQKRSSEELCRECSERYAYRTTPHLVRNKAAIQVQKKA